MPRTTRIFEELFARRPRVPFEADLHSDHRDQYRELGYTCVPRITSDEELDWLRKFYDMLFAERVGAIDRGYFDLSRPYDSDGEDLQPQIIVPEVRFPALLETTFSQNGRKLAARLLDVAPDELVVGGHMIRKPPLIGEALPWHQDEAYWDPGFDYHAVAVWMPLDSATVESGCMHFIPRSHRSPVREHRHVDDDPQIHALVTDDVDESSAVAMPVDPGGASFHHSRLLHSSGANRTPRVRRAYANEFQTPPKRRAVPHVRSWMDQTQAAWAQRKPGVPGRRSAT